MGKVKSLARFSSIEELQARGHIIWITRGVIPRIVASSDSGSRGLAHFCLRRNILKRTGEMGTIKDSKRVSKGKGAERT